MPGRCFLAYELPPDAVVRLAHARDSFVDAAPAWAGEKWVRDELLHVTIRFIGPLDDRVVPAALRALGVACAALPQPSIRLERVRAVPSSHKARMLWATLEDTDGACAELARAVDGVLSSEFGVPAAEKAFSPHITLARAREPRRAPHEAIEAASGCLVPDPGPTDGARSDRGTSSDGAMSVRSLTLLSSTLGPGGPTYVALGAVPVGTD